MVRDNYQYRLSVIVAIYNVEAYLERCLESIVCQDLSKDEYEVLLINDGSTDRSLEIAKRFEEEYTNFIVYSKENGGLSSVRNFGIERSHGRYIMHVDGDDFLEDNVIGKVVKVAEDNDLDLCFFDSQTYPEGRSLNNFNQFPRYHIFTGEYLLLHEMKVSSTWCAIYKNSFIKDSKITFYGRISHQDVEYNYRLYPLAKRIMFTNLLVYNYFIEGESISRTKDINKKKRNLLDNLIIVKNVKQYAENGDCSELIKDLLIRKMNSTEIAFLLSFCKKDNNFGYTFAKEFIKEAQLLSVYPIKGKTYSWKTTLLLPFVNIKWVYLFLVRLLNNK